MLVDIIGLENVLNYIKASKHSKFTIIRAGATGANTSVFESLDTFDNKDAIERFENWANVVNNNVPYKIMLFNEVEMSTDNLGNTKVNKTKGKANKMEALFILNNQVVNVNSVSDKTPVQNIDINSLRSGIIAELKKEQEENLILQKITELNKRIDEFENDDETDDEESPAGMLGGIDANQLQSIMGLVNLFKQQTKAPVINGTIETSNKNENIKNAINRLYKHNKDIDKHLLKLADIADNKPETFNMLIGMLKDF